MARLGDLCIVKSGYAFKSEQFSDEGIPVVRIGNITNNGLSLDDAVYFGEEFWEKNQNYRVNQNDILIAMSGATVGKCCLSESKERLLLNQRVAAITVSEGINIKYIYHIINSDYFANYVLENSAGCAQPNISAKQLMNFEIKDNARQFQDSIAKTLDKVDELIALRREQLVKLDQLVKSRFIELFGDPVKNDMAWKTKPLNDVCDGIGDGLHGTPVYDDNGDYPFINGNNLIDGAITITPTTKMVSAETYAKHYIDISPNAILISINGTLGKLAFYNGEQVMLGKSACYCNLKPSVNKVFVYGVMSSDAFAEFLDNSSTKSTIKNVGLKAMREYKLILPPIELQGQFAAFVEQTEKSKLVIQQSLDKLETLKKSLMQEYFG